MTFLIWSIEHGAWWKPGGKGYTRDRSQAGRFTLDRARDICMSANHWREDSPDEAMVPEW
jgi:hypothetical protein